MSNEVIGSRGKALEDVFYAKEAERFRKARRDEEAAVNRKAELSASSGINDDTVLDQLIALDISSDTLTALSLVPLVEVAWADGTMDEDERSAILSAASESGLSEESADLLGKWLVTQPAGNVLTAWKDYVAAVTESMDVAARDHFKQELLGRAYKVAESAGGILGIGKVSKEEKDMLDELSRAFS